MHAPNTDGLLSPGCLFSFASFRSNGCTVRTRRQANGGSALGSGRSGTCQPAPPHAADSPLIPQAWIAVRRLVNGLAIEIGEPRLDLPGRHHHEDVFIALPAGDATFFTCGIEIGKAPVNSCCISVQHDDESYGHAILAATVFHELHGETGTDEPFGGATSVGSPFDPEPAFRLGRQLPHPLEESEHECLMLLVFTQQDGLHLPSHRSQPLAISSESLSPGSAGSGSDLRAVTTPDFSRWSV